MFEKKWENSPHHNHKVINILDSMPSQSKLDNLNEKINNKSNAFDSLIKSLDEWQNELNKKIERIKQNLKIEIRIIKKLFLNFNTDYIDYIYYSNFNEFFNLVNDCNNLYLKQFIESYYFNEKTKNI